MMIRESGLLFGPPCVLHILNQNFGELTSPRVDQSTTCWPRVGLSASCPVTE